MNLDIHYLSALAYVYRSPFSVLNYLFKCLHGYDHLWLPGLDPCHSRIVFRKRDDVSRAAVKLVCFIKLPLDNISRLLMSIRKRFTMCI